MFFPITPTHNVVLIKPYNFACDFWWLDLTVHAFKPLTCIANTWKCADNRRCIKLSSVCNGKPDCEDFSDEKYCDSAGKVKLPIEKIAEEPVLKNSK